MSSDGDEMPRRELSEELEGESESELLSLLARSVPKPSYAMSPAHVISLACHVVMIREGTSR